MAERDRVIKSLGNGGQGSVDLVEHKDQRLARKAINVNERGLENCNSEVKILRQLRDRKVLIFKDYFFDAEKNMFYIYTEYFRKGDLRNLIKNQNHKDFENKIMAKFMKDLIGVVKYIHSEGIIHRDLKPRNIFISDNDELIIGDFGLAIEKNKQDHRFVGTPGYIAPELYENEVNPPYSEKSDIFAVGCIFYEIYTLRRLYDGTEKEEIKNRILHDREVCFDRNNLARVEPVEKLIMKMIEKDPKKRIDIKGIETRMKIVDEDIDSSLDPDSIIPTTAILSSASTTAASATATTGATATGATATATATGSTADNHHNLTVGFYLLNESVNGKSLKEVIANQYEFNRWWNNRWWNNRCEDILFPVVGQENPPFPYEDAVELRSRNSEYREDLQKLLYLIRNLDNNRSGGISNRIDMFLDMVELPELKNQSDDENILRNMFFSTFKNMTSMLEDLANKE